MPGKPVLMPQLPRTIRGALEAARQQASTLVTVLLMNGVQLFDAVIVETLDDAVILDKMGQVHLVPYHAIADVSWR